MEDEPNKKEESKNKYYDADRVNVFIKEASQNTRDIIAYILLLGGLLLLPFRPFIGGVLVGIVFGLYFSKLLIKPLKQLEEAVDNLGVVKSIILAAFFLALLVVAPGIVVGALAGVGIKELLVADRKEM